jgi:threonine/homoserine/homoserine lactone efflux protein
MISDTAFCLRGFAIGFAIAAPVGPIGVLCIRRSVSGGARAGLATGLGAATADALYGAVAAFGLTAISGFLVGERRWLQLLGGLFLCYLGAKAWRSRSVGSGSGEGMGTLVGAYTSTVILTLTNPATILSFVAVFAGAGLVASPGAGSACALVLGVFLGSAAWWLILSQAAGWLRTRVDPGWMTGINKVSGAVLAAFGLVAVLVGLAQ